MTKKLKLSEIAARIDAHLKRFEKSKDINVDRSGNGLHTYYNAGARAAGSRVFVVYIGYQGASSLTKADAESYLAALDSGYVGSHYGFRWLGK